MRACPGPPTQARRAFQPTNHKAAASSIGGHSPRLMRVLISLLLVVPLALSGCLSPEAEGQFALRVTDAPDNIGDFSYLNVTVTRISLQRSDNATVDLAPSNGTFDLTKLVEGNTSTLFNGSVPVGNYSRLDLFFTDAVGVLAADGSEMPVKAPSGRIFLNTGFTIVEGEETSFLFDVQVHKTGNGDYQFKPNADGSGPGKKGGKL